MLQITTSKFRLIFLRTGKIRIERYNGDLPSEGGECSLEEFDAMIEQFFKERF